MIARYSVLGQQMIQNAEVFATAAHAAIGQKRKYTGADYITHPRAVAEAVQSLPDHTWKQVVVAWLHDVLEDTKVSVQTISDAFGPEIAAAVFSLTNVPAGAGTREERFRMNVAKLIRTDGWVQTVKLADIWHNTLDIVAHDPAFAPKYLREKAEVVQKLTRGDAVLWSMVRDQIANAQKELRNAG